MCCVQALSRFADSVARFDVVGITGDIIKATARYQGRRAANCIKRCGVLAGGRHG